VLKGPAWLPGVFALCACGLSVVTLVALLEVLPMHSDVAVLVSFLAFLAAWAALNRLGNRFALERADC
jgi:hypothetical protein